MTRFIGVVLGAMLPPVGVFLVKGPALAFWLNILLTLLFFVPGQLHALWVIAHIKNDGAPAEDGFSTFLGLLACTFLPPLGVFLKRGIGLQLLLNLLLTALFWFPGSIHALWILVED